MTLVASAMSVGAFGQVEGYFRVVNCGYAWNSLEVEGEDGGFTEGVMHVTAPTTAQPTAGSQDMLTLPGTVMYIKATPAQGSPKTDAQYIDENPNDLIVENLRSQAVDAAKAIYAPMVEYLKQSFVIGIEGLNGVKKWGLNPNDIPGIVDEMFWYMQMFLEPVENYVSKDGWEAEGTLYYLKSSTPNLEPLVKILAEKGFEVSADDLFALMWKETMDYYDANNMQQAKAQWQIFNSYGRIHLGHTYYLIGGTVIPDFKAGTQTHQTGSTPYISFANDNKYYGEGMEPEIKVADMYAVWMLAPVTTEKEDEEAPDTYFAVKNGVKGLDGHYYTTGYFDFPFEAEEGVRVWGINKFYAPKEFQSTDPANSLVAYVVPTEYEGTVPAHTPVVIENIENATGNDVAILQPKDEPADKGDASLMKGIFFDATFDATSTEPSDDDSFEYYELPLDKETTTIYRKDIRVFNRTDNPLHKNNPLGFFKYTGKATNQTVKANKGWMDITDIIPMEDEAVVDDAPDAPDAGANVIIVDAATFAALTDGITEVSKAEKSSNVVYDIQGRIVSNPTNGLYIVNGKKVIK